jgi:fibro-slime domain-containing protein
MRLCLAILIMSSVTSLNAQALPGYPDSIIVPIAIADFHCDRSNPDFFPTIDYHHTSPMVVLGMVSTVLNDKYLPTKGFISRFSYSLEDWFDPEQSSIPRDSIPIYDDTSGVVDSFKTVNHDTTFTKLLFHDSLKFRINLDRRVINGRTATQACYLFDNTHFDPLHNKGFGNDPVDPLLNSSKQNFGFTVTLRTTFINRPDLFIDCESDDDLWLFVNRKLVIDLGGLHQQNRVSVVLDTFHFAPSQTCTLSVFYADRGPSSAAFYLQTNVLGPEPPATRINSDIVSGGFKPPPGTITCDMRGRLVEIPSSRKAQQTRFLKHGRLNRKTMPICIQ